VAHWLSNCQSFVVILFESGAEGIKYPHKITAQMSTAVSFVSTISFRSSQFTQSIHHPFIATQPNREMIGKCMTMMYDMY
jgi:hypothetical protein